MGFEGLVDRLQRCSCKRILNFLYFCRHMGPLKTPESRKAIKIYLLHRDFSASLEDEFWTRRACRVASESVASTDLRAAPHMTTILMDSLTPPPAVCGILPVGNILHLSFLYSLYVIIMLVPFSDPFSIVIVIICDLCVFLPVFWVRVLVFFFVDVL